MVVGEAPRGAAGAAAEEASAGQEAVSEGVGGVHRGVAEAVAVSRGAAGEVVVAGFKVFLRTARFLPMSDTQCGRDIYHGGRGVAGDGPASDLSRATVSSRSCHGDLDWLHWRFRKGFGSLVFCFTLKNIGQLGLCTYEDAAGWKLGMPFGHECFFLVHFCFLMRG